MEPETSGCVRAAELLPGRRRGGGNTAWTGSRVAVCAVRLGLHSNHRGADVSS